MRKLEQQTSPLLPAQRGVLGVEAMSVAPVGSKVSTAEFDSLPDGWCWTTFEIAGKWSTGGTPSRRVPEYFNGNVPWVKITDLNDGEIRSTEENISKQGVENSAAKVLPSGALCIGIYGSIGKLGVLGTPAATNQACANCVVDESTVIRDYLRLFVLHERSAMLSRGRGGNQANLNNKILRAWPLRLSPLAEQRRIVAKVEALLGGMNEVRASLNRVPELLRRFRQSVLTDACSGKLTEDWRAARSVTDEWDHHALSEVGAVTGGITKHSKRTKLPRKVPYMRVANVYAGRLELDDVRTIGVTDAEFDRTRLSEGDLLFVEGNGSVDQIGRVALWDDSIEGCVHQNHLIRFRAGPSLRSTFALLAMMSRQGRDQLMEQAISTAGLHSLSISKISKVECPLPTLEEQDEIVSRAEALLGVADAIEAQVESAIRRAGSITQAILAKAFRGELVPTEADLARAEGRDYEPASTLLERIKAERASSTDSVPKRRSRKRVKRHA